MAATRRGGGKSINKEEFEAACTRIDSQLATAGSTVGRFEDREREYEELRIILQELPEKVRHPIMVPYGPLAFFPGHLEHTGEVLTQLSSEYFVLRTTKHALGLVERRQERLRKEKAGVAKEQRDLQLMRGLAVGEEASVGGGTTVRRDEQGFVDIREPFSEADDEKPRLASSSSEAGKSSEAVPGGDATGDILKRLRELEAQEEQGEVDEPVEMDEMAELDSVMEQAEAGTLTGVAESAQPKREQTAAQAGAELRSPADLFVRMQHIEEEAAAASKQAAAAISAAAGRVAPASFDNFAATTMQNPRSQAAAFAPAPRAPAAPQALRPGDPSAGGVLERNAPTAPRPSAASLPESAGSSAAGAASEEPPKRVSKFKAERQQRGRD